MSDINMKVDLKTLYKQPSDKVLSISRKPGQRFIIIAPDGTRCIVEVKQVNKGGTDGNNRSTRIQFVIMAPPEMRIFREEILNVNTDNTTTT